MTYGPVVTLTNITGIATLTLAPETFRLQFATTGLTATTFVIANRPTPAVVVFLAGGSFTFTNLNSLVGPDAPVHKQLSGAVTAVVTMLKQLNLSQRDFVAFRPRVHRQLEPALVALLNTELSQFGTQGSLPWPAPEERSGHA